MSSNDRNSHEPQESAASESFAALFEADSKARPKRGAGRAFRVGEPVEGTVVRIGKDAVFVDLDGKQEGYLEDVELRDATGALTVSIGEVIRAVIVEMGGRHGGVRLGKSAPKGRGAETLIASMESGLPVEGTVSGTNKGGLEVQVEGIRAFCPARQADVRFVTDLTAFIGQRLKFMVTAVKEGGRDVTLSRRAVLERENEEARAKLEGKLAAGAVLRGRVVSTRDFGAFVDLGGVEGLLPVSELSHDRALRTDDVVKVGEEIDVQILRIEPDEKRAGQQKITLSLKALAGDPWEAIAPTLQEGAILEGKVARLAPFGAFVQLKSGIDGLLHVSEVTLDDKGQPKLPAVGETIPVKIVKIDLAQKRVGLAPAEGGSGGVTRARPRAAALEQGAIVTGKVSRVESFGVFVQIDGAGARGLLPAQELLRGRLGGDLHKLWPLGTDVKAKVVSVDAAGKIRLSIEAMKADEERASFEDYRAKEQERASGNLGALGQKLKLAGIVAAPDPKKKGAGAPKKR
jgi:small subunit ribosomal protein S1